MLSGDTLVLVLVASTPKPVQEYPIVLSAYVYVTLTYDILMLASFTPILVWQSLA
jgi:hypothetical protein